MNLVRALFTGYKMPRLASKTEGRGNGIKTNVLNVTDLAGARRPRLPAHARED